MQETLLHSEKQLLLELSAGNEQSFKELHDMYWEDLYPVTLGFMKSPDLAMDVLQEVFIRIWQNRANMVDIANFKSYIFIATRNEIISQLRKQDRRSVHYSRYGEQVNGYFMEADSKVRLQEANKIIAAAIDLLPTQQKKILELSRSEGLSHAEIAEHLGIDKKAVTNAITRALNTIRNYIQQYDDGSFFISWILLCSLLQ